MSTLTFGKHRVFSKYMSVTTRSYPCFHYLKPRLNVCLGFCFLSKVRFCEVLSTFSLRLPWLRCRKWRLEFHWTRESRPRTERSPRGHQAVTKRSTSRGWTGAGKLYRVVVARTPAPKQGATEQGEGLQGVHRGRVRQTPGREK